MAYVATRGGERAIQQAERLYRAALSPITAERVDHVRDALPFLVDRVMGEASLYAPDLAALALAHPHRWAGAALGHLAFPADRATRCRAGAEPQGRLSPARWPFHSAFPARDRFCRPEAAGRTDGDAGRRTGPLRVYAYPVSEPCPILIGIPERNC